MLVMTVGFKEDSKFNVIDDSAAVANGGDEDILAVGNIEFRFSNEFEAKLEATEAGTEVKANGVNDVFGFSAWLSDIVDELGINVVNLGDMDPGNVLLTDFVGPRSLHGP